MDTTQILKQDISELEGWMQNQPRFATVLFIGSETIFFALLIAAYVYYTGASGDGPNARTVLDPMKTGFYTVCLLTSSITNWLADRARRNERSGATSTWLVVTMALGLIFLYGEMTEYAKLLHQNVTVSRDLFGSTYYTLTGFHALHVTIGLVLLGTMLVISLRGNMNPKQGRAFECVSLYWHFVDAVWVAVFTTVYLWSTR